MSDGWITLNDGHGPESRTVMIPAYTVTAIVESYRDSRGWETRVTATGHTFIVNERAEAVRQLISEANEVP